MQIDGCGTKKRKCVICNHMTGRYKGFAYVDGIEIDVPVCNACWNKVGYMLRDSMDIHLKGISQSIRMSHIITSDEKKLAEM